MSNSPNLNQTQKEQIGLLINSTWDLQKAREKIQLAIGASDLGRGYLEQLADLVASIEEDIENIHDEAAAIEKVRDAATAATNERFGDFTDSFQEHVADIRANR